MSPAVAEAIAWIEQAALLMDQAHANLKGTGLDTVLVGFGIPWRWMDVRQLRQQCEMMAKNIRSAANAE